MKMAEINFLCIHRKLRSKRLAPLLIKEITRRVNLCNIWQAIYTSGTVIPKPFSCANYFHRNLNPVKNVKTSFSHLPEHLSLAAFKKSLKLPEFPLAQLNGTPRPMEKRDASAVFALYKTQQAKFDVYFKYTQPELLSQLLPRDKTVYTIVIEQDKKVTDYISFYSLPSTIMNGERLQHDYKTMNVAYLYYWACTANSFVDVMNYALVYAQSILPEEE